MSSPIFNLVDNTGIKDKTDQYETLRVQLPDIIRAWKASLFSFEWLTPAGDIKKPEQLSPDQAEKYHAVCHALKNGEALERPVLGIGMMDNIEIGSKRDVLLTLAAQGATEMDVHIPKANKTDFSDYLC